MKKFFKWLLIVFILLFLLIIYARYVGTSGLITKEYTIYDKNVSDDFDGMKVVHLADLHYNRAISLDQVKDIVNEEFTAKMETKFDEIAEGNEKWKDVIREF